MPKKIVTKTASELSVKQVAGMTGLLLAGSAVIALIMTIFFAGR
jgi:hypothetical protein